MKGICRVVGAVVLMLYVLAWFDVVDFNLCIGVPGACAARPMPAQAQGVGI